MQDTRTGEFKPIDINAAYKNFGSFDKRISEIMRFKTAGEKAGIPVEYQGPVFRIDEVITIKGANFRVRGFEGGLLHLEGIPKRN